MDEYYNSIYTGEEIDRRLGLAGEVADVVYFDANDVSIWEAGAIASSTGANSTSTTRIRTTGYIGTGVKKISVAAGYKYMVFGYSSGTYMGTWNGSSFVKSGNWRTTDLDLTTLPAYDLRLVMATSPTDSAISPAAATHLTLTAALTDSGRAADAEETERGLLEFHDYFHEAVENLIDLNNVQPGFWNGSTFTDNENYYHGYMPCVAGDVVYFNMPVSSYSVTFFDSGKNYISRLLFTSSEDKNWFEVPANSDIAFFSFPLSRETANLFVLTKARIPFSYIPGYDRAYYATANSQLYEKISLLADPQDSTHIELSQNKGNVIVKFVDISSNIGWTPFIFHSMQAVFSMRGFVLLARNSQYYIAVSSGMRTLYRMPINSTSGQSTTLETYEEKTTIPTVLRKYYISLSETGKVYVKELHTETTWNLDISQFLDETYTLGLGLMVAPNASAYNNTRGMIYAGTDLTPEAYFKPGLALGYQWAGKKWYAYGTSITNVSNEGKYPTYLAAMSKMTLYNKGISGGGIGDLGGTSTGQVYDAICNITDGKLEADLITLETGANDTGVAVPLGTIYDTGRTTLAGCLNDCLRYLQENTDAQIVVMCSPATKTIPTASSHKYYEWAQMVEQICYLNRIHFINSNNNMGCAKLASAKGPSYVADNIHQTELGGYIFAQNVWYQLRNIPLFYTTLPTA